MLKKLRSKKGMTMSLSIVLAVVITAVSLSVSALVATVSINQVNTAKAKYETLVLENKLYDFMNDYYEKKDGNKSVYQPKVLYEKSPDPSLIDEENKNQVLAAIKKLNSRQQNLIWEVFYKGKTLSEIAKTNGVSKSAITQQMQLILRKLKEILKDF